MVHISNTKGLAVYPIKQVAHSTFDHHPYLYLLCLNHTTSSQAENNAQNIMRRKIIQQGIGKSESDHGDGG